jgi:hypothetical protein
MSLKSSRTRKDRTRKDRGKVAAYEKIAKSPRPLVTLLLVDFVRTTFYASIQFSNKFTHTFNTSSLHCQTTMPASKNSAKGDATNAKAANAASNASASSHGHDTEMEAPNARPGRIATRAENANQHPGKIQAGKERAPRRTKVQMEEYRAQLAAAKLEKEEAKKAKEVEDREKYKRIAAFEQDMREGNEDHFATPRPRPRPRPRSTQNPIILQAGNPLQCTMSYLQLPMGDTDDGVSGQSAKGDVDMDFGYAEGLGGESPLTVDTDTETDTRPTKKAKVAAGKGKATKRDDPTDDEVEVVEQSGTEDAEEKEQKKKGKGKTVVRDGIRDALKSHGDRLPDTIKQMRYIFLTLPFVVPSCIMLTLDEITLFYYSISTSANAPKASGLIKDWSLKVAAAKDISRPTSKKSSSRGTPALTNATTRASESTSVAPLSQVRRAPEITIDFVGGLSDEDEAIGDERHAAITSPPKNGRRLTSMVSHITLMNFLGLLAFGMRSGCRLSDQHEAFDFL